MQQPDVTSHLLLLLHIRSRAGCASGREYYAVIETAPNASSPSPHSPAPFLRRRRQQTTSVADGAVCAERVAGGFSSRRYLASLFFFRCYLFIFLSLHSEVVSLGAPVNVRARACFRERVRRNDEVNT